MLRLRLPILVLVAAAFAIASPSAAAVPFAGGDSSANIALDRADRWVMLRHVAERSGHLTKLYLHVKVEGSANCPHKGRPGYAAGTTGRWLATTHPVRPDGQPDLSRVLAADEVVPCERHRSESLDLGLGFAVTAGQELATVIRNVDPDSATNFASVNFLYRKTGVLGANGRNERSPAALDRFYGLDPRETVGYSTDAGRTWSVPGGPYGILSGSTSFIPTYLHEYADGTRSGQPYYSSAAISGPLAMVWPRAPHAWRIGALGAYTSGGGAADVRLIVDGVERGRAHLSGTGALRVPIAPVEVPAGATVRVETIAGSNGLALRKGYGDAVWAGLMGLGTSYHWYLEGDPQKAAPVYPLAADRSVSPPVSPPAQCACSPTFDPVVAPRPPAPLSTVLGPVAQHRAGPAEQTRPRTRRRVAPMRSRRSARGREARMCRARVRRAKARQGRRAAAYARCDRRARICRMRVRRARVRHGRRAAAKLRCGRRPGRTQRRPRRS